LHPGKQALARANFNRLLGSVNVPTTAHGAGAQQLTSGQRPRGDLTKARDVALWLGQGWARMTLAELATAFGLGHYTSVSTAIARARREAAENAVQAGRVSEIEDRLGE
jgi:chromosomal replication initiation ATPase DnaA